MNLKEKDPLLIPLLKEPLLAYPKVGKKETYYKIGGH